MVEHAGRMHTARLLDSAGRPRRCSPPDGHGAKRRPGSGQALARTEAVREAYARCGERMSGEDERMALDRGLDWLLDDLTGRVEHVRHALVLSNDGLVTGASTGLAREDAEHLAAVSSGLHSLARGSGRHFRAGRARQTMVEFDEALLFVTAAGEGSCLCVLSAAEADVGQVAYEMTLLVNRVGEHLGVAMRNDGAEGQDLL
ncbi:hypothetical protein Sfulv_57970 [Streptomyces fulvorobeus]|uniref:Roadblock/LAMTOR2 domain-containing protein n=2 Tax=Streptomyces fulvorobeus TaxID=284028 RepID=A0A7J0CH04_9ACTN|nr:hypothetical protein Sfulv_57970 [Streptomyces fulvorobeus]